LNANVNPNSQSTTVVFEYGTSTSYGAKSSAKSIGSGAGSTNVSISAAGLAPSTTYHVRVVAENAAGTTSGSDVTFTTTGPPIVHTSSVTGIGQTSATLNASVDASGHSTHWYFQYGTSTSYGGVTPAQSTSSGAHNVSLTIAGLTSGKAYHFRLVAQNSSGTSTTPDATFTTAGPAITLSVSTATAIARHAVTLSGRVASGRSNESVAVFAQRYGSGSFAAVTTVLTDAGGTWSVIVRPAIGTTYKAVWSGSTTSTVSVAVRPSVSFRTLAHQRFATHVAAARSFRGRVVQLQRHLLNGRWLTIARAHLNRSSTAIFHPKLKRGRWTLRVAISVNQAGGGYLAGFSPLLTVRRR
jgi:hypothetical protein